MNSDNVVRTISCECRSCSRNYLAFTNTKEFKLKICYRCFMNGSAYHFKIIKAVKVEKDIEKGNKDGSWIPLGYVSIANPVDWGSTSESAMMDALNTDFKTDKLEFIEELSNSAFSHIVKDKIGNLFVVSISDED